MQRPSVTFLDLQQALARRDREVINGILQSWLSSGADVGDRWHLFADILAQNGEWSLALQAIDRHRSVSPRDPARQLAGAVMLARAGRHSEATAQAEVLIASKPDNPTYRHFAGTLASEAGLFDQATHHFLSVLTAAPGSAQTWLELAAIHRFIPGDELFLSLQRAASAACEPSARAPLSYALGKALDDIGEYDDAFAAFAEGAAIVASARPYDPAQDYKDAADTLKAWDGVALPPFESTSSVGHVFVTGLPRSGTTLVEQILASHPSIAGGGELNILPIVSRETTTLARQALSVLNQTGASARLLDLYTRLVAERFGQGARAVDKSLEIGRLLGLVASISPSSPVIWVRRQPLDAAWSCFRTHFAQGVPWSWSQESIARHFRVEDQVFEFWAERLGERLMVVDYEALVRSPEAWTKLIESHVGLAHDPRSLAPHTTPRQVVTSSVAQVRKPIYQHAIGSAQPYKGHLSQFVQIYGEQ